MFKLFKENCLGKWLKNDRTKEVFLVNKRELGLKDDCLKSLLLDECLFTAEEANAIITEVRG